MQRIPYNTDLSLRLVFSDVDNAPVSMKDVEFDLWLTTKPGGEAYLAACRNGICFNVEILPDCSVLVHLDNHHLRPGVLKANLIIHADSEVMPDGCHDIRLEPKIPVELVDSHCQCHGHTHAPQAPVIVNVTLPMRRPSLTHHVTQKELEDAISGLSGTLGATEADIADIIGIFKLK